MVWSVFFLRQAAPLQAPPQGRHTHRCLVLLGHLRVPLHECAIVALRHALSHAVLERLAQGDAFPSCPPESVGCARVALPADKIPDGRRTGANRAATWGWE